jgi:hypothetical protein
VEEEADSCNQMRYTVVEVPPSKLAQLVIEGTLAVEGMQPATTVEEVEAEVEPKAKPVIKLWTDKTHKEFKITTCKDNNGKEVIEILNSDDEMLNEGKGKELDAQDGDGNTPDS